LSRLIPFYKVESIGNDFVLVQEEDARSLALCDYDTFLSNLSVQASERRFGVGSDGLLVVSHSDGRVSMRMFNPDGSEDFCGNGIRCAAVHALDQGWVQESFTMEHRGQEVPCKVCGDGCVETMLGAASYRPEDVPVHFLDDPANTFDRVVWADRDTIVRGSALSTGSTHVVVPVPQLPEDREFFRISPLIENDPQFPDRTSVIWTQERGPGELDIRIWERGAGETLGCGTGASAAAVDYMRRNSSTGVVSVESRGGVLQISAPSWDAPLFVRGTAKEMFRGSFLLRD
jgi:diaminopimelate epimerase